MTSEIRIVFTQSQYLRECNRAHNAITDTKVEVGLANKIWRANRIFRDARQQLPQKNWLRPLDEVPMEKNVYVVKKGMDSDIKLFNCRYV